MMSHDFTDKKVGLLGYGTENRGVVAYLQKRGAAITICDKNEHLVTELPDVAYRLGPEYLDNLADFDVVVRTPGIPFTHRSIQEAKAAGVIITSQTQLFLEACPAKVIGVTGTKGKGTTSSLIASVFDVADISYLLGGNIGEPLLSRVDEITPEQWVILELSSFQLHDLTISPHIAVVLGVTIDHMDHHRDEAEYISVKKNIVRYQRPEDFAVINSDSVTSMHFADEARSAIYYFSRLNAVEQGAFVTDDQVVLRLPGQTDQPIIRTDELQLVGAYNLENVTAAAVASALAGVTLSAIAEGLKRFRGLSHRLEFVAEKHGVKYYDDSKATTPDSTIAAISAFAEPMTLLVGGSPKGADFNDLVTAIIGSSITTVICIGTEGQKIKQSLEEAGASMQIVDGDETMQQIVQQAAALSQPGSVVLLSPAAASFDMFKNAEDRGNQFQAAVKEL
jgi:UDP-N-acetylmuramoylalanine--D-glutamate ligase